MTPAPWRVDRHPPRLVLGEQFGREAPTGLVLEVEIRQCLSILVADDEAGVVVLLDRPRRRETACGGQGAMIAPFPLL